MIEDFLKNAMNALREHQRMQKERETNELMAEIEAFHINNAIDKALATNNKEAFLQLTGGVQS